jgi:hypothetical protein
MCTSQWPRCLLKKKQLLDIHTYTCRLIIQYNACFFPSLFHRRTQIADVCLSTIETDGCPCEDPRERGPELETRRNWHMRGGSSIGQPASMWVGVWVGVWDALSQRYLWIESYTHTELSLLSMQTLCTFSGDSGQELHLISRISFWVFRKWVPSAPGLIGGVPAINSICYLLHNSICYLLHTSYEEVPQ